MIRVMLGENRTILGAVDTKRIVGFHLDGTAPEHEYRYVLQLEYGHTLTVSALDMQYILMAMKEEVGEL